MPAAGLWMTEDYLTARYGAANQSILADMENGGDNTAITATLQQAIDDSEDEVLTNYLSTRYALPISLTDADKVSLRRLTGPITEYWLHENRGDRETENPFRKGRDDARAQLDELTMPPWPGENVISFLESANLAGWNASSGNATAITRNLNDNTITQQGLLGNPCGIYPW